MKLTLVTRGFLQLSGLDRQINGGRTCGYFRQKDLGFPHASSAQRARWIFDGSAVENTTRIFSLIHW